MVFCLTSRGCKWGLILLLAALCSFTRLQTANATCCHCCLPILVDPATRRQSISSRTQAYAATLAGKAVSYGRKAQPLFLHKILSPGRLTERPTVLAALAVGAWVVSNKHPALWKSKWLYPSQQQSEESTDGDGQDSSTDQAKQEEPSAISGAMIGAIGFYKSYISPILPPGCRFLPTCSQYGVQAIQKYGPSKGAVLTAWRLARCTPFGGRGYDPPVWPPVPYNYSQ